MNGNNKGRSYDVSLVVEHIPKEIKNFMRNKNIMTNIYSIQAYNSIVYGYFCIRFIEFILEGKSLLDCSNLFSPNNYEQNDKIIPKYFR